MVTGKAGSSNFSFGVKPPQALHSIHWTHPPQRLLNHVLLAFHQDLQLLKVLKRWSTIKQRGDYLLRCRERGRRLRQGSSSWLLLPLTGFLKIPLQARRRHEVPRSRRLYSMSTLRSDYALNLGLVELMHSRRCRHLHRKARHICPFRFRPCRVGLVPRRE